MGWKITKEFNFEYGHRVWSQKLDCRLSIDSRCACRHSHGHSGKVLVSLKSIELKEGMVTDFKHLNWFKKWVDKVLDHKMILDINDPAIPHFYPLAQNSLVNVDGMYDIVRPEVYWDKPLPLQEIYEGLVFVPFVPTSENLSKWLFDLIQANMQLINVNVESVTLYETVKSQSTYTGS